MTQYVIRNPNNPIVRDLYKDIPLVDAQGNVVTDAQGRVVCDRYVVQGSVGISEQEVDNKISQQITNGLVDTTSTQTIGGNKSFSGTVTVTTPTKEVDGQTVTDTSDNTSKAANTKFVQAIKAELAEDISNIAEKSNAITVSDTVPNVSNMPIASGIIHPAQNIITENPDVSILALQQDMWAYDSTKTYVVGSYVFDENKDICKCIQGNGPTNIHAPSDSAYWLKLGGNALIPNQTIVSELPLTDANLHLKDGALLSGSGVYSAYVDLIADLYNGGTASTSFCTEAEWQTSNTNYGFCNKFVYDSVNNTVRLPKVNSEHGALIKSYSSGTDWYRIYQDGWCEQGGYGNANMGTAGIRTVSLIIPYINSNYVISVKAERTGGDFNSTSNETTRGGVASGAPIVTNSKQNNSFGTTGNPSVWWNTCGYTDVSDLQTAPIYEYIVLGTVTKTSIQIDIDNVLADLALKADKDFSNVNAPVQAFKDMSIGWNIPDYSAGIKITSSPFTAPSDGVINANGIIAPNIGGWAYLYINGTQVGAQNHTANWVERTSSEFIIGKGDEFTYSNVSTASGTLTFFPYKGAN